MMPVLKALRRIITPQFLKPEWIIWTNTPEFGWEFSPDGFSSELSLNIDFNGQGGNVHVMIRNSLAPLLDTTDYYISWADPDCDTKVIKILKDWMVKLWEDNYLERAGYPNPSVGGERPTP